jgi:putative restriction endonuclease
MKAIVLESGMGSQYEDAPDSYEFQSRYLKFFEPVVSGEQLIAVIYEPRGTTAGRMAYVGYAEVMSQPIATGRRNRAGEDLWRVHYRHPVVQFEPPVPREILGEPMESWLRARDRGRNRNVATLGRAVRSLSDEDLERILSLAGVDLLLELSDGAMLEPKETLIATHERLERLITVFERRAAFRREVLDAYEYQCAVTGLGLGAVARTKSLGILDAAHIRPVKASGADSVSNGLALTPTLHRLFDQGLFTVRYVEDNLEVLTSPRLSRGMVEVPERGVSLAVNDGTRLSLPRHGVFWPSRDQVIYHQRKVFKSEVP